MRLVQEFQEMTESVGTTLAPLGRRYETSHLEELTLLVEVSGANALNAFEVRGRAMSDRRVTAVPLKSSAFMSPDQVSIFATAEPGSLPAAGRCLLRLNVSGLAEIEVAAAGVGTTSVKTSAGGYS